MTAAQNSSQPDPTLIISLQACHASMFLAGRKTYPITGCQLKTCWMTKYL